MRRRGEQPARICQRPGANSSEAVVGRAPIHRLIAVLKGCLLSAMAATLLGAAIVCPPVDVGCVDSHADSHDEEHSADPCGHEAAAFCCRSLECFLPSDDDELRNAPPPRRNAHRGLPVVTCESQFYRPPTLRRARMPDRGPPFPLPAHLQSMPGGPRAPPVRPCA